MLKFLYGMLAGYLVCSIEIALWLIRKNYKSLNEVPDND